MKTYFAQSFGIGWIIEPGQRRHPLRPRLDLRNHSPTGFAWGYNGSGPAQLALAILADCYVDKTALRYYQQFKELVIATRSKDAPLSLSVYEVMRAVENIIEDEKINAGPQNHDLPL